MDDLTAKLTELLKDPDTMQKISSLSNMLSKENDENTSPQNNKSPNIDNSTINSLLSALGGSTNQNSNTTPNNTSQKEDISGMLMRLAPIMSSIKKDDKNSNLLNALRPFLGEERKKKLDESSKMLQLMKMLPLLKDAGILENLF